MSSPASLEGGGWRVEFTRQGDRFAHAVWRGTGRGKNEDRAIEAPPSALVGAQPAWSLLLESIEGTPDDAWPASPALKELHFENRPGGRRLALLVGMAGTSHWSLSVELDAADGRLTFDVACRVHTGPERLGSRYRLSVDETECPLALEPIAGESARLVTLADRQLVIEAPRVVGPCPRTVRWRYVMKAAAGK